MTSRGPAAVPEETAHRQDLPESDRHYQYKGIKKFFTAKTEKYFFGAIFPRKAYREVPTLFKSTLDDFGLDSLAATSAGMVDHVVTLHVVSGEFEFG